VTERALLPHEREREREVVRVLLLDALAAAGLLIFGFLADSLTLIADAVRGNLAFLVEIYAWMTMRWIHRGRFAEYEYGTGKIERLVNVAIALSLAGAAAWIGWSALSSLHDQPPSSSLFFAAGLGIAQYNLGVNIYGLIRFVRSNEDRPSLILESQIDARFVKVVSSFVVFVVMVASNLVPDPAVGRFLDVLGSLFVCVIMVRSAVSQLRESIPDLLDRSTSDATQHAVYGALVDSFADYEDVLDVRTRRSGGEVFVEVRLAFDEAATMAQMAQVQTRIADRVREALPDAHVSVLAALSKPRAVPGGRTIVPAPG